jgi:hypothetical protein
MFLLRLTPELSRADRDRGEPVLLAQREVSTKPRNGVGLNELLGAWEPEKNEAPVLLPKDRSPENIGAPRELSVKPEASRPHSGIRHCPVTQAKPERAQNCNRRITRRQTIRRALQTKSLKLKQAQQNSRMLFSA